MRNEALENLQVFIGRDEGDDPSRWEVAVSQTLEQERKELESQRTE
jgi:hypothetical protein